MTEHQNTEFETGAFTVNEFVTWARISRPTAYKEAREGRLRLRKLGNKTLIARSDAQAWLDNLPSMQVAC